MESCNQSPKGINLSAVPFPRSGLFNWVHSLFSWEEAGQRPNRGWGPKEERLSIHPSVCPSMCLSVHPYVYLSICSLSWFWLFEPQAWLARLGNRFGLLCLGPGWLCLLFDWQGIRPVWVGLVWPQVWLAGLQAWLAWPQFWLARPQAKLAGPQSKQAGFQV